QRCRRHFGWLGPAVEHPARWIGKRWFPAASADAVSCLRAIGRIAPRPVLLLNGARDPIVLPASARDLYGAAQQPKSLCILPRSSHGYPHAAEQSAYRETVLRFLDSALDDA